jgi:predicted kinase
MKRVHMMIGLPGSGKKEYAKKLANDLKQPLISLNTIRNVHLDWNHDDILKEAYRLCSESLISSDEVIYDADNTTILDRQDFKTALKQFDSDVEIIAYYFKEDLEVCIARVIHNNESRKERYFPPEKIRTMAQTFELPTNNEVKKLITIQEE